MILDGKDGVLNGYELRHHLIAPGGKLVFSLREFVNSDGVRYNPEAWKPRTIYASGDGAARCQYAIVRREQHLRQRFRTLGIA